MLQTRRVYVFLGHVLENPLDTVIISLSVIQSTSPSAKEDAVLLGEMVNTEAADARVQEAQPREPFGS